MIPKQSNLVEGLLWDVYHFGYMWFLFVFRWIWWTGLTTCGRGTLSIDKQKPQMSCLRWNIPKFRGNILCNILQDVLASGNHLTLLAHISSNTTFPNFLPADLKITDKVWLFPTVPCFTPKHTLFISLPAAGCDSSRLLGSRCLMRKRGGSSQPAAVSLRILFSQSEYWVFPAQKGLLSHFLSVCISLSLLII